MNAQQIVGMCIVVSAAAAVAVLGSPKANPVAKPAVKLAAAEVGPPPDHIADAGKMVKCLCSGNCNCPDCRCKEPDECNPPSQKLGTIQPGQSVQIDAGPLVAAIEKFTEPPKAAPEYVTVRQPYTVSRGFRGRRSFTAYREVTMLKSEYEAQQAQAKSRPATYYGGGCANGRCGR